MTPTTPNERYVLAVTLAGVTGDPTDVDYAAWDRVRELCREAGHAPFPALLPAALPGLLRAVLLGLDGLVVGWTPDSLAEAAAQAGRFDPSAQAALLNCARLSGVAVPVPSGPDSRFDDAPPRRPSSEQDRACARFLLPEAASCIVWSGTDPD